MHCWSEVSHDLVYKTLNGSPSTDGKRILDAINGLMRTGEVMLGQLKASIEARIKTQKLPFANPFELGVFLRQYTGDDDDQRLVYLGDLFYVLKPLGLDTLLKLGPVLDAWKKKTPEIPTKYPVVLSIFDFIFSDRFDQKTAGFVLDKPYLPESTNQPESEASKWAAVSRILRMAFDPEALGPDANGAAPASLPGCHAHLQQKRLLDREGGVSFEDLSNKDAHEAQKDMEELWEWLAKKTRT